LGYLLVEQVTWLAPFIYRGLKGVGVEGYMFSQKTENRV
jgi:hypothetical protein